MEEQSIPSHRAPGSFLAIRTPLQATIPSFC